MFLYSMFSGTDKATILRFILGTTYLFIEIFFCSHKLRRVLRKALYLAEYKFNCREPSMLLNELSNQVAEIYQDIFPEIGNNLEKVFKILQTRNLIQYLRYFS